jgi:hypothetical protein
MIPKLSVKSFITDDMFKCHRSLPRVSSPQKSILSWQRIANHKLYFSNNYVKLKLSPFTQHNHKIICLLKAERLKENVTFTWLEHQYDFFTSLWEFSIPRSMWFWLSEGNSSPFLKSIITQYHSGPGKDGANIPHNIYPLNTSGKKSGQKVVCGLLRAHKINNIFWDWPLSEEQKTACIDEHVKKLEHLCTEVVKFIVSHYGKQYGDFSNIKDKSIINATSRYIPQRIEVRYLSR